MFTTETPKSTQLWLDLRVPKWHQLEFDLDYTQPEKKTDYGKLQQTVPLYYDNGADWNITAIATPALHINSGGDIKSRLIVTPDLIIESTHKRPNAVVRFFHKHLFNFKWETI